jgi:hypothetical protein
MSFPSGSSERQRRELLCKELWIQDTGQSLCRAGVEGEERRFVPDLGGLLRDFSYPISAILPLQIVHFHN